MSTRERWIVYPLLFLALGLVLRSSFEESISEIEFRCQTIECQNLRVKLINGQPVVPHPVMVVVPSPAAAAGQATVEQESADEETSNESAHRETDRESPDGS